MLAPVTHILPLTLIRRARTLPMPGKVLVRAGQKVSATDTVAEAKLNAEYMLLDIGRGLGLPADKADALLKVKAGEQVAENDILAGPVGLFRRVVRCPRDGHIALAGGGQVLLEIATKPFQLKAGIPGEVVELMPDRGVLIETSGALVQGVWGNGQMEFGVLNVVAKDPAHELKTGDLDVSLRGSIVLAGYLGQEDLLRMAEDLPLRGLVLSSASAALAPAIERATLPIMLVEGFGKRPFNGPTYKLLGSSERRDAALNAAHWNPYAGERPELVLPAPALTNVLPPPESSRLEVDVTVRLRRGPFAGAVGVVKALKGATVFPGGLRTQAVDVQLENGASATVPLANLEVIA